MSYIFESTNSTKIYLKNLTTNIIGDSVTLDGFSEWDPKDENEVDKNINQELLPSPIGMRMAIETQIINRDNVNNQYRVLRLINWINKVQNGTHRLIVYPSYDADMDITTLDNFECVMDGYYKIEKLHSFLKSGQNFTFNFIEYIPNRQYIPKIPSVSTGGAIPFSPGGGIAV